MRSGTLGRREGVFVKIAKKTAVAIDYKLTIDGGIVVDASEKGHPLWYLHGEGNIIPGLERALDGLEPGAQKKVVVAPKDGYGVVDPSRIHQVPKDRFPAGQYNLGDVVTATAPDGSENDARITAMDAKTFTLDFNHELAGKELTFEITVAEVRAATKDELSHGHVHGPGGHHHH
jgi:FKBP-type peptidyl-prolyl cis-trans isomerase SlyD